MIIFCFHSLEKNINSIFIGIRNTFYTKSISLTFFLYSLVINNNLPTISVVDIPSVLLKTLFMSELKKIVVI